MLGILYVIATPIGNLDDLSPRALSTLTQADAIICEDTRVSKKLLFAFEIQNKLLVAYHQHSDPFVTRRIGDLLRSGKNCALLTDAGTPGISDPGGRLVAALSVELGADFKAVPIPGPSAVTAILSVSGLPADSFLFLGFPPHKKGRAKYFRRVAESQETVVFYESPHRIQKTLIELATACVAGTAEPRGEPSEFYGDPAVSRRIVVGRELTKKFETIYRGPVSQAATLVPEADHRGEFVIVVEAS